jgi:hypothetical protein
LQAPKQEYGAGQEAARAVAILHVGPGDVDGQQQPQGVHQDMAFAALDLLARVIAHRFPGAVTLD